MSDSIFITPVDTEATWGNLRMRAYKNRRTAKNPESTRYENQTNPLSVGKTVWLASTIILVIFGWWHVDKAITDMHYRQCETILINATTQPEQQADQL
jgi:hypothetical protein